MSKINLGDGSVDTTTPQDVEKKQDSEFEALLVKWYNEVKAMTFHSKADYSAKGLEMHFSETQLLRGLMARLDYIISEAKILKRKLSSNLEANKAVYEDELDKLKTNPVSLINKGYSYQEREAYYKTNPGLLPYRVKIRKLECKVSDISTFIDVSTSKYKFLESSKNDLLLQTSLIRLGYNIREINN